MHEAVEGAAVWRGDELARAPEWNLSWTAEERDALDAIAAGADAGAGAAAVLDRRGAAIRDALEEGRGAVRLRGLEPARHEERALERILLGIARAVGTPVPQTVSGDLLFRVADAGLDDRDPKARGPNSRKALTFHSDRCDAIGFLCVRPAAAGGDNLVVSAGAIHNAIRADRPDLLDALYAPFWWQRHNIDTANVHPHYAMPVFAREGGRFAVTLMQVLIERAHRAPGVPDLTPLQREALAEVQRLAADPRFHLRFRQEPGDLLFLNNFVTLHSRTEFEDPPAGADAADPRGRLLLRVWVSVPNSRPLPESWRPHYGEVAAGAVRGGLVR